MPTAWFQCQPHILCTAEIQDAKLTCLCVPGLVIKKIDSSEYKLILRELTWSALVWPLLVTSDDRTDFLSLNPNGRVEWFSMHEPSAFEAFAGRIVFSEGWACFQCIGAGQPFLDHVTLTQSHDLSFQSLCVAATYLNCVEGKAASKGRDKLLVALANHFDADPDELLQRDKNLKPGDQMDSFDIGFVQDILAGMDTEEQNEYDKMRTKAESHDELNKRNQWASWFKEKMTEVEEQARLVLGMQHLNPRACWCFANEDLFPK
eukprot:s444_g53.t1